MSHESEVHFRVAYALHLHLVVAILTAKIFLKSKIYTFNINGFILKMVQNQIPYLFE